MITANLDLIPLPLKRRWSAISENIVRDSSTLGYNRPASANDARIFGRDIIMRNKYLEKGVVYQQQRGLSSEKNGNFEDQSMTKPHATSEENAPQQGVNADQRGANYTRQVTSSIEPHEDNSTCLCYPELWRIVGFDPLGLGHEGLFTMKIYYQLGGRDLSEFETLFAKIRNFYHQLRSFPVTPGIVYIPSDHRQVNIKTIWMIVNSNLDHLEYYAYHGRYPPISPNLRDKLTPLPHTMFNIDSRYFQGQQTWSKPETTSGCLPKGLQTAISRDEKGQSGYQQPMHANLTGKTQYQQYPGQYQFDTKASDLKNGTCWESYYQDIMQQSPNAPQRTPPSPQVQNESKRRSTDMPQVPRMWPSSHVVEDGKRRKVEPSTRTLPAVQNMDITYPNQVAQQYQPWMAKQSQETPPFTNNGRNTQTSGDYGRMSMHPLISVREHACLQVDTRTWTTQETLTQTQSRQNWPRPGHQPTSDQDVPRVKKEPLGDTDQALDLSVFSTANCQAEGTSTRTVMRETNGADYRQRSDEPGEFIAGKSQVYSLKNMVDKHILQQQFPGNTGNDHMPSINRNSEVEAILINGNVSLNYPFRGAVPWDREFELQHSLQTPTVPNNQQVGPTIHSRTGQPANCSLNAHAPEQPSSSLENGLASNKNVINKLLNGGPSLPRSGCVNSQQGLAQPYSVNQVVDPTKILQNEPETLRKMEVPDMKVITEGHSTLCHMLAGLVGYPLSLVTNMGLEEHPDEPASKGATTKRISKIGAKILSQFLAEGTDCYDKVVDMINDQYDVIDENFLKSKHTDDDRSPNQRKLLRNLHHRLCDRERVQASPNYIPNGTSDILARMLSGFKGYSTELQNFSAINPKLDTDRDSEGESTYSCGSECSGCDSCRGQSRGDDTWETSLKNLLPDNTLRQTEIPGHIKKIKRGAVLKRHPLHSYRMPLPARKRHIFMLQEDENASTDSHNHNQCSEKKDFVVGNNKTLTQLVDDNSSVSESNGLSTTSTDSNKGLTEVKSTDNCSTIGNKSIKQTVSNSTCGSSLKSFTHDTDSNTSALVTNFTDLTDDSCSNRSSTQEGEPGSFGSSILGLSNARKRKVSLAINSIPNELLQIDTDNTFSGADSNLPVSSLSDSESSCASSSLSGDDGSLSRSRGLSTKMSEWSTSDVVHFISSIPGCEKYGLIFRQHSITGSDLPHLTENYLHSVMKLSHEAAIRIRLTMAASCRSVPATASDKNREPQ